jgi:hypothetical protein
MTSVAKDDRQVPQQVDRALRRRTPLVRLLVGGGALVLVAAVATVVLLGRDHRLSKAPWWDAASTGLITLCDSAGNAVQSGSLHAKPFVETAVGQTAPGAAFAVHGRSATLYAYQPRQGVQPTQWSGQMLTAPSQYTNPARPMAAATTKDVALADFLAAFPAGWKGTVQLRLYLGAPRAGVQSQKYDSADLVVTGDSWRLLRGGRDGCRSGSATSLETQPLGGAS